MSTFRFADPGWANALWLVVGLVVLLIWLDHRGGNALDRFLSRLMQQRLVFRSSTMRRWIKVAFLGLSCGLLVMALMRPQWGLTYHKTTRVGCQIMVCMDVSNSMLAEDTAPNRLERAKAEVTDLLSYLDGDQVGLIAFAGTAAVLCPLTPDHGFFRLILDESGPHTVGRGGTRLAEPIRKAVAGFRSESNVARAILLITDGEDHDSFPAQAAEEAAERGINIIAIGFGDEQGSQIEITDPETGARSVVEDQNGDPVITRLDGETLRKIAQITEGAYIPAGTGMLDLKSIYESHISPLTRNQLDDRGRAVRNEGFQWAVLFSLVFLLVTVVVGRTTTPAGNFTWKPSSVGAKLTSILLFIPLLASLTSMCPAVYAVDTVQSYPTSNVDNRAATAAPVEAPPADTNNDSPEKPAPDQEVPTDPREAYNEALAHLDGELDRAEILLATARQQSAADGEVRFRATFNMGWLEAQRANKSLQDDPQKALEYLRASADWYSDAVRLRPNHHDARHNLEVVLRRALELADSLQKKDPGKLEERLDELIQQQRKLLVDVRELVERIDSAADVHAADRHRSEFRALAVEQRRILADTQLVAGSSRDELDAIMAKKHDERQAAEQLRAAQLQNLQHFMHQSLQRMGQARSQLRRRQVERAYRRLSAALSELKRARDQLRDPVEVLGALLGDGFSLAQYTGLMATARESTLGAATDAPDWLTQDYLSDLQGTMTERTAELASRLEAGIENPSAAIGPQPAYPPSGQSDQAATSDPSVARLLNKARRATPKIKQAEQSFTAAGAAMDSEDFRAALDQQANAIMQLQYAREIFLELKGLIELMFAEQIRIQAGLSPADQPYEESKADENSTEKSSLIEPSDEDISWLRELQKKNHDRGYRLAEEIKFEQQQLIARSSESQAQNDPAQPSEREAADARRMRFEQASMLLDQAKLEMQQVLDRLEASSNTASQDEPPTDDSSDVDVPLNKEKLPKKTPSDDEPVDEDLSSEDSKAVPSDVANKDNLALASMAADNAVDKLQQLRRLFFSVVEHLRDTADQQSNLNDETEQVRTLAEEDDVQRSSGPLIPRQRELETISLQIADALKQQSEQTPAQTSMDPNSSPQPTPQDQQVGEQFRQASELVSSAGQNMKQAADTMEEAPPILATARESQDQALENLLKALSLLVPPEQQQPPQSQQDNQQEKSQNGEQQQPQDSDQQQQDTQIDPARLLQAVRDREAQRRRMKSKNRRVDYQPVEKDW